jgi:ferredoxin
VSEIDPEIFGDPDEFVELTCDGKVYKVPLGISILRALQYAGFKLDYGRICWNGDCQDCKSSFKFKLADQARQGLACQIKVEDDLEIETLPLASKAAE